MSKDDSRQMSVESVIMRNRDDDCMVVVRISAMSVVEANSLCDVVGRRFHELIRDAIGLPTINYPPDTPLQ